MFGISFYELIVVFMLLVMLFKPKEVISILFKLGKILRKIKHLCSNVHDKFEELTVLGNPDDYFLKNQKNHTENKQISKSGINNKNSSI